MTQSGLYSHRRWLNAWNSGFRKYRDCTIYVAKTRALSSCAVSAQLICALVFPYAKLKASFLLMQLKLYKILLSFTNKVKD